MKHRACTFGLALLVSCGADKSGDPDSATGTGASTGASTGIVDTTNAGSTSTSTSSGSTGAPVPTTTGDETCGTACTGTSEGASFLPGDPDAGSGVECDVLAEDCPVGQKCMPYVRDGGGTSWNGLKCVPVDPAPVGVGEACDAPGNGLTGVDNCDKHVMCWDVDNDMGVCAAMCVDNACAPGFNCFIANDGVLNLCLQACDVNLPDCPPGTGCLPVLGGGVCAPA